MGYINSKNPPTHTKKKKKENKAKNQKTMIQMNQRTIDLQMSYEFGDILAWVNIIFIGTEEEELMQGGEDEHNELCDSQSINNTLFS